MSYLEPGVGSKDTSPFTENGNLKMPVSAAGPSYEISPSTFVTIVYNLEALVDKSVLVAFDLHNQFCIRPHPSLYRDWHFMPPAAALLVDCGIMVGIGRYVILSSEDPLALRLILDVLDVPHGCYAAKVNPAMLDLLQDALTVRNEDEIPSVRVMRASLSNHAA